MREKSKSKDIVSQATKANYANDSEEVDADGTRKKRPLIDKLHSKRRANEHRTFENGEQIDKVQQFVSKRLKQALKEKASKQEFKKRAESARSEEKVSQITKSSVLASKMAGSLKTMVQGSF